MIKNRIVSTHADYIFVIVRKPNGWQASRIDEVPRGCEILSEQYVASYAEAYDDLVRCNRLSMERDLDQWAVIQAPSGCL